jgi:hypothetical protein
VLLELFFYDATGIVTAARKYRAGKAVVFLLYVLHHLHDESRKYIVEIFLVEMMNWIYLFIHR